jgi:diguanylate cyclase (GGDEF)-like protein
MHSQIKDEVARVAALRELELLDCPPSHNFDSITRLCATLFGCRFSLISLVDETRQWFLSAEGIDLRETPRDVSFCQHALAAGKTLVVEDAAVDPRFANNPLVLGGPRIRSYLGQPVEGPGGHLLGALCVADDRPRRFGEAERELLKHFGKIVEELIKAHSESIATTRVNQLLWEETRALRKSNRLLSQAEKIGGIGAWELNLSTRRLHFSDQMYALSGLPHRTAIDTERALQFYRPEDRPRVDDAIRRAAITGSPFDYETDFLTETGEIKRIRCVGERLDGKDQHSARIVGVIQDISAAHHANLALERAANYDSLTGVYNRHAFDRCLKEKIKRHNEHNCRLSLMLIDLDGFKDINDTFGHVIGDVVLEEISARVMKVIDQDAVLARWGGDEFAILPPLGISPAEVSVLAEKVLTAIGGQVEVAGNKLQLSGTCGVAWYEKGMQTRELLRRADLALYEGKKRERNTIHFYHPRLEAGNKARQKAIAQVRSALEGDRLYAAYQPIVDLSDGSLIGLEALLRLTTKEGSKLAAGEVLPALLDPILSREITANMLRSVCADMSTLLAAHPDLQFVSLNVAESDLLGRGFSSKLLEALREAGVPEHLITLEITETMLLVNDNATVRRVLAGLRDAGMSIALDDFGTGFSSLSHLRDFPISKVKIDSSFVQSMVQDQQARAIVHAIVAMAKNMGMEVIAEGVETDEQRLILQLTGCRSGQGFLFSPAMDLSSLTLSALRNEASAMHDLRRRA